MCKLYILSVHIYSHCKSLHCCFVVNRAKKRLGKSIIDIDCYFLPNGFVLPKAVLDPKAGVVLVFVLPKAVVVLLLEPNPVLDQKK